MRSAGRDDEINEHGEKGDGEDGKGVLESDGESDAMGEWSSSSEADDEEFSCDEQGEETDISSEDDQPDTRYSNFSSMKLSFIYAFSDNETDNQLSPNPSREIVLQCGYIDFVSNDDSDEEGDLTIEGLAELMEEAREPGNFRQLASVKRQVQHAQQTGKDQRTLAQSYILHHWRRPLTSLLLHGPTPELFVDASQFGIGVYLGTRWLAWTFLHGHPAIAYGPDGKIDASWAELIAVEIGVYAVVAAGYRHTPLSIWSDNMGVVKALGRKSWTTNRDLDGILGRILDLCDSHGLVESPKWISSKMNPADKASRGRYPPKKMMLSYRSILPWRLKEFMARVDLDVSVLANLSGE